MNLVNELRERKSERERQKFISTLSLSLFFSINDAEKGKYVKPEIYVN